VEENCKKNQAKLSFICAKITFIAVRDSISEPMSQTKMLLGNKKYQQPSTTLEN